MKVRHKEKHYIVGEIFQETATHYLIYLSDAVEGDSPCYAYPKACYEPVPTEQWEDVTGQVEVVEPMFHKGSQIGDSGVFHTGMKLADLVCQGKYRLRKVYVLFGEQPTLNPRATLGRWASAFIVERKLP